MKFDKVIQEKGLKTVIQEELNIPEDHFSSWQTDLYLLFTKDRYDWLKENYQFFTNCVISWSNVEGQEWYGKRFIEIPFAAMRRPVDLKKGVEFYGGEVR